MVDSKLKTLLAVVEYKNYSEAAKEIGLTQPAVSQHIHQLEQEYGITVFHRIGSEAVLTEDGQILVKYARRILSMYDRLAQKIKDNKRRTRYLVIGITHTSESNIIPEVLAEYSSRNPGTKIRIVSDSIKNLYDKLNTYEIDLAIMEGPVTSRKFASVLLDTDSLVAVLSEQNPLSRKSLLPVEDLKNENLILRSQGSGTTDLFSAQLGKLGLTLDDFNVILEMDSVATIKDLVRKNMGISVLPKSACFEEIRSRSLRVLPIEDMDMAREINLVFPRDFEERPVLEDLTSIYHQKARQIA